MAGAWSWLCPPSCAEVRNQWIYSCHPYTPSGRGQRQLDLSFRFISKVLAPLVPLAAVSRRHWPPRSECSLAPLVPLAAVTRRHWPPRSECSLDVNICGATEQCRYGRQRHWRQTTRLPDGHRLQTLRRAVNASTKLSRDRRVCTAGVFDKARALVDIYRVVGTVRLYRYWPLVRCRRIFLNETNRIQVKYSTTIKHNTLIFVIQC